jgi:hypothetical protein
LCYIGKDHVRARNPAQAAIEVLHLCIGGRSYDDGRN